ncbi:hypothetical protein HA42_07975 [Pantoea deleyi]|nr:hypothetical protein HA42_07975 [Pantoea deleyi]
MQQRTDVADHRITLIAEQKKGLKKGRDNEAELPSRSGAIYLTAVTFQKRIDPCANSSVIHQHIRLRLFNKVHHFVGPLQL